MPPVEFRFEPRDLAPGDGKSKALDVRGLEIRRIVSPAEPWFVRAYARLWEEFGAAGELESEEVLARRLAWPTTVEADGLALRYDLLAVIEGDELAAVRDHTAVADGEGATVHLSHVLVEPRWRRTGLAGWMRALPLQTARAVLRAASAPDDAPTVLAGEMEYPDPADPAREVRLRAYERAGFLKVDPSIRYHQPDFRPPEVIDQTGAPRPLPFQLILRRVGREAERQLGRAELLRTIEHLYAIYAREFRAQDMRAVYAQLAQLRHRAEPLNLLPPTA